MLERFLWASQVIWLRNGLVGDDTDGHIDDLSRFLNRDTILTMVTDDKESVNYETLRENLDILNSVKDRSGKPFTIVTLPLPDTTARVPTRSEEHTSELQSRGHLVCRLLLEKKKYDI